MAPLLLRCLLVLPLLTLSGTASAAFYGTRFERQPSPAELTELGRALFADPALSASGRMACASCHDPRHGYASGNARAVQLGGPRLDQPGLRAVPALMYRQATPAFTLHAHEADGDDGADLGPAGGRDWDGRADSAHEQAAGPLLSPFEMANADRGAVLARLRRARSAALFRVTFGAHALDEPDKAWNGLLWALEVFQQSPPDFSPYSSKYDAFLRGQTGLSPAEKRGLALFNDPAKGACARCHPSAVRRGVSPIFSDEGYAALGLPRNTAIPANADPAWHDLGLCGPLRHDLADQPGTCGLFKVPSLRNVALRRTYFHNGVYRDLRAAVAFYALRDTQPERIYPRGADGRPVKFDDLPPAARRNVESAPPFGTTADGRARLSARDVDDLVAFLRTLTDGWSAKAR